MPSLANATVAEVMHRGIVFCETNAPLSEVARTMADARVHCIAVRGADHAGDPLVWGSSRTLDLLRGGMGTDVDPPAGALAHTPVISIRANMPLVQAAEAMTAYGVNHLVVIDADRHQPVGVLSTLDIAAHLGSAAKPLERPTDGDRSPVSVQAASTRTSDWVVGRSCVRRRPDGGVSSRIW
jgi:CBS domain-containing protein